MTSMTVPKILVLFLVIRQTSSSARPGQVPEVHDGTKCSPQNYPYVVQVEYTGLSFKCLGTLIRSDLVLTGADCVNRRLNASTTVVKAGLFGPYTEIREVVNGTVSENYTSSGESADNIGLLMLEKPFPNATVPKIAHLPVKRFSKTTCHRVKLVGLGKDSFNCLEVLLFHCREENPNISQIYKRKAFCGTTVINLGDQERDWGSPVICHGVVIGLAVIQEKLVQSGLAFLKVSGFISFLQKYVKLEYIVEDDPIEPTEAINGTTINGTKVTLIPKHLIHNATHAQRGDYIDKGTLSRNLVQIPLLIILIVLALLVK